MTYDSSRHDLLYPLMVYDLSRHVRDDSWRYMIRFVSIVLMYAGFVLCTCAHVYCIKTSGMSSHSYFVCTSVVVCICCQKSGVANRLLWHCERDYFTNVAKIFLTMFLESMICVGWDHKLTLSSRHVWRRDIGKLHRLLQRRHSNEGILAIYIQQSTDKYVFIVYTKIHLSLLLSLWSHCCTW